MLINSTQRRFGIGIWINNSSQHFLGFALFLARTISIMMPIRLPSFEEERGGHKENGEWGLSKRTGDLLRRARGFFNQKKEVF